MRYLSCGGFWAACLGIRGCDRCSIFPARLPSSGRCGLGSVPGLVYRRLLGPSCHHCFRRPIFPGSRLSRFLPRCSTTSPLWGDRPSVLHRMGRDGGKVAAPGRRAPQIICGCEAWTQWVCSAPSSGTTGVTLRAFAVRRWLAGSSSWSSSPMRASRWSSPKRRGSPWNVSPQLETEAPRGNANLCLLTKCISVL